MAEKCCAELWNSASYSSYACGARAKVQRFGKWYCGRHDPEKAKEREVKRQARWDAAANARLAERNAERIRDAKAKEFPVLVKALKLSEFITVGGEPGCFWCHRAADGKHESECLTGIALAQADAIENEKETP